jgi:polar amino acid transport system substrate-binding protein
MQNGKLDGIAVDYMYEIESKLHLKSNCEIAKVWSEVLEKIKDKRADFTISTDVTPDRLEYAVFSKPYATYPIVIAANKNVGFIPNMSFLSGKKIAVAKNYTAEKILKKHYKDLDLIETKDTIEALELVKNGKAYAAIDILPVLAYVINKNYPSSLKIVGKTPFSFSVRVMVRKDYAQLIPAINRAIDCISSKKRKEIYNRWISVTYQKGYTLRQIVIFILIGIVVLSLISFWVLMLKREIRTRKKLEEELEKLATTDKLTSIYNRHKIDLSLREQIEVAQRYERTFGVIFFDIDHFKDINDKYGHKVGDMVLVELSRLVSKVIRKSDLFGRWGGEEFLIILPETSKDESVKLAQKLREIIQKHDFEKIGKLTCSFGVTSYRLNDSSDSIIKRVDKELYKAKNRGRNRVEFA